MILFCLLFLLSSCGSSSESGGGSISVKLELTQGVDPSIFSPDDRIVVRIYGPDFSEISHEFVRSQSQGTIDDVPEGVDRVIKVDEYDSLGNLLARGFAYGLVLREGEDTGLFLMDANNNKVKLIDIFWKIKNLVGNGESGNVIEDINPKNTPLQNPSSIAVDENGKIYISVFLENKIFEVSNEIIKRYGGNGDSGYADDLSDALNSPIYRPKTITYIFGKGLYFVESVNGAVRYINENGKIEDNLNLTDTDIGSSGFQGKDLIFSYKNGRTIFMIDYTNKIITQFGDLGYFDTWVSYPDSIIYKGCVFGYFPHNLFLCGDNQSSKIYKIKYDDNGLITEYTDHIYGNSPGSIHGPLPPDSAGLVNPRDVTVDLDGNLYIADTGNNAIRMVVGGAL
jgi:hypothetical protein